MLRFGHITNYDAQGRVTVLIDEDNFKTDFIPVIVSNSNKDKNGCTIDINTLVAVVLDEINPMNGVCLGAVNVEPRLSVDKKYHTFSDGTHLEYDRQSHKLTADVKGEIEACADKITFKSPVYSTDDIFDKKGSMQSIRDFINNHSHTNGNNGGNTGKPSSQI